MFVQRHLCWMTSGNGKCTVHCCKEVFVHQCAGRNGDRQQWQSITRLAHAGWLPKYNHLNALSTILYSFVAGIGSSLALYGDNIVYTFLLFYDLEKKLIVFVLLVRFCFNASTPKLLLLYLNQTKLVALSYVPLRPIVVHVC